MQSKRVRDTIHMIRWCLLRMLLKSTLEIKSLASDFIIMVPGKTVQQSFQEEECFWHECGLWMEKDT